MGALAMKFYCTECGRPYEGWSEFRFICPPCAKEMGLADAVAKGIIGGAETTP